MDKQKHRLKRLKINELSQVDRGANQEAHVVLMKRDIEKQQHEELSDELVKLAKLHGQEEMTTDFREAVSDELERRQMYQIMDEVWPLMDALRESVAGATTNLSGDARSEKIEQNVEAFKERLMQTVNQEVNDMTPEELTKKLEEMENEVSTLKADKESLEAERNEALAKAGMTDAEKAYMDGMSDEQKKQFMAMSSDDRQKQMKEKPMSKSDDDVSKRLEGFEEELKKRDEEINKRDEEIEVLKAKFEMAEISKRVETEYPNLPGEPIAKAKLLKSIEAIEDEEVRKAGLEILKAHNDTCGKAMQEVGKNGGQDTSATDELEKMAKKYAEDNSVSVAKAYDAVLNTAEGKALYEQTLSH